MRPALALRFAAPVLFLSGAAVRAQAASGFDGADNAVGLSLGTGLILFSTLTALLYLAGRRRWATHEAELSAEIEELRQKAERARAFLASETQFAVVWAGARGEPEIEGDVSLALDAATAPRRVLGFGAWLPPDQAKALENNVALLREMGQGFRQDLVSHNGRHLEAEGRAIGSRVVMRVRDVSGDRLELMRLREVHAAQTAQFNVLRGLLDLSSHPVWTRGADQALDWVNMAYAKAVDA